jgi:hypothetical protein
LSDTPAQQPPSSGSGPDPERHDGQQPQYPVGQPQGYPVGQPPQYPASHDPAGQPPQQFGAGQPPQYPAAPPQQPWQGAGAPVGQPGGAVAYGAQPPSKSRGRRVLVTVAGILAFVIAAALVRWGFASFGGPSKQELVDEGVAKISEQTTFPKRVDSITTWTGVDAEDDAIHYRYSVNADPAAISERSIRASVLSNLCSTKATRDILEEDIAMRYSYVFPGSDKTVDLEFTNDDC